MWFSLMILFLLVLIILFIIGLYNGLVYQRNSIYNAFAQIDVQLTRRHDLIPNMVEIAKRYMAHEQDTLTAVIEARNQAVNALQQTGNKQHTLPDIHKIAHTETSLSKSIGACYVTFERYPELKADVQMRELQEELASTENRIAFARQHFNDTVTQYNTMRESFPANIIAGFFSFQKQAWLEIDNITNKRDAVKIDFN